MKTLRDYLSQLFGLKVDIVTKNGLKPRIRDRSTSKIANRDESENPRKSFAFK